MLNQDEKDLLIKLIAEVRINPLDQSSMKLLAALQQVAKKIVSLPTEPPAEAPLTLAK